MFKECLKCGLPLDGQRSFYRATGDKHPLCYAADHPYVPKKTVREVICSMDDPVLVRNLVLQCIGTEEGELLVYEFNRQMQSRHECSCRDVSSQPRKKMEEK